MRILETFDQELYERDLKEQATSKGIQQGWEKAHINIIQKSLQRVNQSKRLLMHWRHL